MRKVNFKRWFLVALSVFLLTVLGSTSITYCVLPPVYTASALIQVSIRPELEVMMLNQTHTDWFQAQSDTILSTEVLLPIISEHDLERSWAHRLFKQANPLSDSEALAYLRKILRIEKASQPHAFQITVASDVPQEAADIANAIAGPYKAASYELAAQSARPEIFQQVLHQKKVVAEKISIYNQLRKLADGGPDRYIGPNSPDLQQSMPYVKEFIKAGQEVEREHLVLESLQLRLKANPDETFIITIDPAGVPTVPSSPNKPLVLAISIAVGLVLGAIIASLVEIILSFRRSPKSSAT